MKPHYIAVKNFASYVDETLDFSALPNLFAVVGLNGAGKSTLFTDAITFALFNRARSMNASGHGVENIIHDGKEHVEVEFEFEMNGNIYKIIRRRSANAHELEFYINGVSHAEKITETEKKIRDTIKMDYETFLDTICIGQGKSDSFMSKKPDQRKEVFGEVLGLSKYEVLEAETKEHRKRIVDEIAVIERRLEDYGDAVKSRSEFENDIIIGTDELTRLEGELEALEGELERELSNKAQHETRLHSRNDIIQRRRNAKEKLDKTLDSITRGQALVDDIKGKLEDKELINSVLVAAREAQENYQSKYQEISNKKSSLEATVNLLTKQARELKSKHDRLQEHNEAECDFCGQGITSGSKEDSLNRFKSDALALIGEVNEKKTMIENLSTDMTEYQRKINSSKQEVHRLTEEIKQQNEYETKLAGFTARLQELENQKVTQTTEYEEAMSQEVPDVETATFRDAQLRLTISTTRKEHADWQTKVAIAKRELEKINKKEKDIVSLETKLSQLRAEHEELSDLVKAFGKQGIQAIIIESALPDIEAEINDILSMLTDNKVSIEFRTQKAKKTKSKKDAPASIETLDILIKDENVTRIYEVYSGGEKFRVDFACHVGLARYLARRAGAAIRFFIVDEGIGSQDANAKALLYRCMSMLTTIFDNVIVISHIEDFVEEFDSRLLVYKDGRNGSKVRLLS